VRKKGYSVGAAFCRAGTCAPPWYFLREAWRRATGARPTGRFSGVLTAVLISIILYLTFAIAPALADQSISVSNINRGTAGEDEFRAGQALTLRQPVWWESDIPWRITVRSLNADLGMSDDGRYVKPLGDLQWKLSDERQWTKLRRDDEEMNASDEPGSGVFSVDYRALLDWKRDRPGDYSAALRFTISGI